MPKVTIFLDDKEDLKVDVFKSENRLKSKEKAIKEVIRRFFKIK